MKASKYAVFGVFEPALTYNGGAEIMNQIVDVIMKKERKDSIAIIESNGSQYTYGYIYDKAGALAEKLQNCNINILVLFPNKIEFVVALLAVFMADKTAVPINGQLTVAEITEMANLCSSNTLLIYNAIVLNAEICIQKIEYSINGNDNCKTYHEIKYKNEVAMLFPTSGTYGKPKLVRLTHTNIISEMLSLNENYSMSQSTCELTIIPLSSIAACVGHLFAVMSVGAKLVLYDGKINPVKVFSLIDKYNVEITGCPPTVLAAMLSYMTADSFRLESLKIFILGGEQVTQEQINRFQIYLDKVKFLPAYGLTEASSLVTGLVSDELREDSVGRPLKNFNVKIRLEDDYDALPFEIGEILIRGEAVTNGYYGSDIENKLIRKGWLHTGDLGYMDSDGYLYITGRIKNIIIIAGQNVNIEEVEKVLLSNEMILHARVYSYKDENLGNTIGADIVLKQPFSLNHQEIITFCKERLAKYKIPSKFAFVEKIDVIGMGKKVRC